MLPGVGFEPTNLPLTRRRRERRLPALPRHSGTDWRTTAHRPKSGYFGPVGHEFTVRSLDDRRQRIAGLRDEPSRDEGGARPPSICSALPKLKDAPIAGLRPGTFWAAVTAARRCGQPRFCRQNSREKMTTRHLCCHSRESGPRVTLSSDSRKQSPGAAISEAYGFRLCPRLRGGAAGMTVLLARGFFQRPVNRPRNEKISIVSFEPPRIKICQHWRFRFDQRTPSGLPSVTPVRRTVIEWR